MYCSATAKVVVELKELLKGNSVCDNLDVLTPVQIDSLKQAAKGLQNTANSDKALKLVKALFTDYKAFDSYIVGRTQDILKLAENMELSDALRLFWLEV